MHHHTDRTVHTTAFGTPVGEHWLEREMGRPGEIVPMTQLISCSSLNVQFIRNISFKRIPDAI